MTQAYSDPSRESDEHALPDIECFYNDEHRPDHIRGEEGERMPSGYYYWYCFPGCLPDSEAYGPFDTEELAIKDAQDNYNL